jgi:hypothetical protein
MNSFHQFFSIRLDLGKWGYEALKDDSVKIDGMKEKQKFVDCVRWMNLLPCIYMKDNILEHQL